MSFEDEQFDDGFNDDGTDGVQLELWKRLFRYALAYKRELVFLVIAAVATAVEHAVRNADDSRRAPSFFSRSQQKTVIACPLGLSCREKEGHHARIRFPTAPWAVVRPSHPQVVPVRWNRPAALLLRALHRGP